MRFGQYQACMHSEETYYTQDCASPEEPIGNSCTCHKVKVTSSSYLKSDTMHEAYSRSIVLQASQHRKQGDSGSSCLTICKRGGTRGYNTRAGNKRGPNPGCAPIARAPSKSTWLTSLYGTNIIGTTVQCVSTDRLDKRSESSKSSLLPAMSVGE